MGTCMIFVEAAQDLKIVARSSLASETLMAGFAPGIVTIPEIETMSKWFIRTICMDLLLIRLRQLSAYQLLAFCSH